MVKLTTREYILDLISKNPNWNVLDLGCGADGLKTAHVWADSRDHSDKYLPGTFFQTDALDTPFEDDEFDFVFSSHVAEHVVHPGLFCRELARIGKRGYIEVPTPLFDNLVVGNFDPSPDGHIWWVRFDIVKEEVMFTPRMQVLYPMLYPADTTILDPFFRNCMVTGMFWEDSIQAQIDPAPVPSLICKAGHLSNKDSIPLVDTWSNRRLTESYVFAASRDQGKGAGIEEIAVEIRWHSPNPYQDNDEK